jgi:hypothetical protein
MKKKGGGKRKWWGDRERHYNYAGQETFTMSSLKSPVLKVPRQCPFAFLVEVKGKVVLVHNYLSTLT